jgi:CRISPR-associated RAMP protein (TIGR02581 family)
MKTKSDQLLDMRTFHSRLVLRGTLRLRTGLRVGAGRDTQIEAGSDLPIVKTVDGRPYIPGSSFKGAWRATTEGLLRGYSGNGNLACISVPRDAEAVPPEVCISQAAVGLLKASSDPPEDCPHALGPRVEEVKGQSLDEALRTLSCWTCRVFGAPWLASKVLVKDLTVASAWDELTRPEVRDGVSIDRDRGSAVPKHKYAYEVVPAETTFDVEIVVDNASDEELGVAWLGLLAFQHGHILLGGARSRGMGWCELEIDWSRSQWLTHDNLVEGLFPDDPSQQAGSLEEIGEAKTMEWLNAFLREVGPEGNANE